MGSNLVQEWTISTLALAEDWLARSLEIVRKYHPEFMFSDCGSGKLLCDAIS